MNFIQQKDSIIIEHKNLLKDFKNRKKFNDIIHINIIKKITHFILAIQQYKKIKIQDKDFFIHKFFDIKQNLIFDIKNINLELFNKIISQSTYTKSIQYIQNNNIHFGKIEMKIIEIFDNIFN